MAKIYYARIKRDSSFAIIDVPILWRDQVQTLLEAETD